jgi:hypothetical protein
MPKSPENATFLRAKRISPTFRDTTETLARLSVPDGVKDVRRGVDEELGAEFPLFGIIAAFDLGKRYKSFPSLPLLGYHIARNVSSYYDARPGRNVFAFAVALHYRIGSSLVKFVVKLVFALRQLAQERLDGLKRANNVIHVLLPVSD